MANIFDYIFNVGGNYTATLNGMTEDDWAAWYAQALWLEQWRLRNQAEMIDGLFGKKN